MEKAINTGAGPELFLALVAATGTDLDRVQTELIAALENVRYKAHPIKLSSLLSELQGYRDQLRASPADQYIESRMTQGNELRRNTLRNDALAILAVAEIRKIRRDFESKDGASQNQHAYIFRSLKHPDELETLRRIYGPAFFAIAAYAPHDARRDALAQRIAASYGETQSSKYFSEAERLMLRDMEEASLPYGQNVRRTYHRADVFVDTTSREVMASSLNRFVELIFGNTLQTPTRSEYAMFHAKASALRSAELGRQVGAAISRPNGDIVAVGTNEVPRFGGGLYWCDDKPDMREFVLGYDSNDRNKKNLIADTLMRLQKAGWLTPDKLDLDCERLVAEASEGEKPLFPAESAIGSVIEYGRAVHAEMAAIVDAARRGVSIADCIMFTTTFPCHLCARHIVAAGIKKLIYIEPYPKSLAAELYPDSIKVEGSLDCAAQVVFEPFVGVAPIQYMRLFEASNRKNKDGLARLFDASLAVLRYRASERLYLEDEDFLLTEFDKNLKGQTSLFGGGRNG